MFPWTRLAKAANSLVLPHSKSRRQNPLSTNRLKKRCYSRLQKFLVQLPHVRACQVFAQPRDYSNTFFLNVIYVAKSKCVVVQDSPDHFPSLFPCQQVVLISRTEPPQTQQVLLFGVSMGRACKHQSKTARHFQAMFFSISWNLEMKSIVSHIYDGDFSSDSYNSCSATSASFSVGVSIPLTIVRYGAFCLCSEGESNIAFLLMMGLASGLGVRKNLSNFQPLPTLFMGTLRWSSDMTRRWLSF